MDDSETLRLDIWLDVACLFKTRSQAQDACRRGRVLVNGQPGKAHRAIRVGDEVSIALPAGRSRELTIAGLEPNHVPRARARELYEDHTPPPSPDEIEMRRLQRLSTPIPRPRGAGAPKKRERRRLMRTKEDWGEG